MEKFLYLLWGLLLEKLRAGGNQRIHKPCAVLAGAAASLFNAVLDKVVIASLWLDNVEVVLCFSNRKIACCAILLLSPSLSYPGFSTGKISQELARIGLEWIEYKSIFLSLYFYIPSGFRTSGE